MTMLQIYNSLTRQLEEFRPIEAGTVRMYVCGMTVYDYCHLGHARVLVVFDVVYRWLMARGLDVTYVRNITDIDDKIIKRAAENDEDINALTTRFIAAMHEDADALGVLRPNHEPKATDNIDAIIRMIEQLIARDHAYAADNGDVYYAVETFEGYGQLSGKKIEELQAGARVEVGEAKRDPLDFVLWKASKPGEPAWDSPWGPGRPGWHIECSAMSTRLLGNHFDIHGGGQDLQFPHHENEIAQSEGATCEHFVNYWMHNGFVRINEEKMSKSLGNFFTVREILERYRPEEIRYFILTSQYRSPLNYADDQLDAARAALTRLYTALRGLPEARVPEGTDYERRFGEAMDDDFNTPIALSVLFDLARDINRARDKGPNEAATLGALLKQLAGHLGLLQDDPDDFLQGRSSNVITASGNLVMPAMGLKGEGTVTTALTDAEIELLIQARADARKAKDFAEADRIRDELQSKGVILEDGAGGTTWRRG